MQRQLSVYRRWLNSHGTPDLPSPTIRVRCMCLPHRGSPCSAYSVQATGVVITHLANVNTSSLALNASKNFAGGSPPSVSIRSPVRWSGIASATQEFYDPPSVSIRLV